MKFLFYGEENMPSVAPLEGFDLSHRIIAIYLLYREVLVENLRFTYRGQGLSVYDLLP